LKTLTKEYNVEEFIPGNCYYMYEDSSCEMSQFVLEIGPIKLDTIDWVIDENDVVNFPKVSEKYVIPITPIITYLEAFSEEKIINEFNLTSPNVYFYRVEKPILTEHYTLEELVDTNYKIQKVIVSQESKLVKTSVSKKPKKLNDNQIYYFQSYWFDLKRLISEGF